MPFYSHLVAFFIVIVWTTCVVGDESGTEEFELNGRKYVVYKRQLSFWDAQALCAENNMDIVTVDSKELQDLIDDKAKVGGYWIGLFKIWTSELKGDWHWWANGEEHVSKRVFKQWCDGEEEANTKDEIVVVNLEKCWQNWPPFSQMSGTICEERVFTIDDDEEEKEEDNEDEHNEMGGDMCELEGSKNYCKKLESILPAVKAAIFVSDWLRIKF